MPLPSKRRECIRLHGVRQNNLKGFDLDIPLGSLVVVTGLSGSGKSSLVFDTLHAEGQRCYVETFSAYTRQFLELLPKPRLDSVENIRPSIAIDQRNTVKTSRSTVGTITGLCDYAKIWFSHAAECFDPDTGLRIADCTPASAWQAACAAHDGATVLVAFPVARPSGLRWGDILPNLSAQGYTRLLIPRPGAPRKLATIDEASAIFLKDPPASVHVVQDLVKTIGENRSRFIEAAETAFHFGKGELSLFTQEPGGAWTEASRAFAGLRSPATGRTFRPASPGMFSFNSPLGACPACRGFGRVIAIDMNLVIPDPRRSIADNAVRPWEGRIYGESKRDCIRFCRKRGIPVSRPFAELSPEQQKLIIEGEPGYGENGYEWPEAWYGVNGFFRWLESKTYKMHVRVFLSRWRSYNTCPACGGTRLQPESLCWKWRGRTLPDLYRLPVSELLSLLASARPAATGHRSQVALDAILARLRYLDLVGLGYLTPGRSSRTLSGGEVQRVNLTSCLGTSLTDTLFVLDEPSIGLHAGDLRRLTGILRSLTDAGNTVVVVEHDESVMRAADHLVELGPGPGAAGGNVIYSGPPEGILRQAAAVPGERDGRDIRDARVPADASHSSLVTLHSSLSPGPVVSGPLQPFSITGAYLSGRETVPVPARRRPVDAATPLLRIRGASRHNIAGMDLDVPLRRLVCLSGVSGSGKSTLLENVIHQGLRVRAGEPAENPAAIASLDCGLGFTERICVDQSPASRTPRSNPALFAGAWSRIRELYARTPEAGAAGFTASSFSFNSGDGRCEHCQGLGFEQVEMQFLSDVFVPCPHCGGRRFKPEILAIRWNGLSVADLLDTPVRDALGLFTGDPDIHARLSALDRIGLGYLTLGQPLNTLSGGEAQRLKLVRHLTGIGAPDSSDDPCRTPAAGDSIGDSPANINLPNGMSASGALLLLDEPTTGLHRHDVRRLVSILHELVDRGHSVIVIEHNLDVLANADWLIELGPGAGAKGGRVVATGTPESLARTQAPTAGFLREHLAGATGGGRDQRDGKDISNDSGAADASHSSPPSALLAAEPAAPYAAAPAALRQIEVRGARENNLKNLDVDIPRRALTVVTGLSGSGKSTLAFDIVFAEGQRRFMESMSPYARQFVEQLARPDVDAVSGIPPTVAIEQRAARSGGKSTVATLTGVAPYLRLLYAKLGIQHHPETGKAVQPMSLPSLRRLLAEALVAPGARRAAVLHLCAPLVRGRKGHHQPLATWLAKHGFELMRADGRLLRVDAFRKLDRHRAHDIEAVVASLDRGSAPAARDKALAEALRLGGGTCFLLHPKDGILTWFSTTRTDAETGESFPELEPAHFSFSSPKGWCPACRGHGRIFPWMLEGGDDDVPPEIADLAHVLRGEIEGAGSAPCPECGGERLNRVSRAVRLHLLRREPVSLPGLLRLPPQELMKTLDRLRLDERGRLIAQDILPQIAGRLRFLGEVGLGYLPLDRAADSLSGGEAQRIRLASQLGSKLTGVLYVLDEPSIGLHAADNERLIASLENLRDRGNTLLVVEHDDVIMGRADRIIDLGPGAGVNGGQVLACGTPEELRRQAATQREKDERDRRDIKEASEPAGACMQAIHPSALPPALAPRLSTLDSFSIHPPVAGFGEAGSDHAGSPTPATVPGHQPSSFCLQPSLTVHYLEKGIPHPLNGRYRAPPAAGGWIRLDGALLHNLRSVNLRIPAGRLTVVCGPGGAGKSTLIREVLGPAAAHALKERVTRLSGRGFARARSGATTMFRELSLPEGFRSVIEVDQEPIGKTPRSTPATYLGLFDIVRGIFATLPEARIRGWNAGRFSFNTPGGRCETCAGAGRIRMEMSFMPDAHLPCDACGGSRYGPELDDIRWNGLNVGQVLRLTFEEAASFFAFHNRMHAICRLMVDTGLGYLTLGQGSPTLSGGEAQRLKLVTELSKGIESVRERSRGVHPHHLYLLEEPTIGLHLDDCVKLLRLLHALVDQGHTVVVIEHHLDVIAEADHVVELGPGGGPAGGRIVYQGPLAGLLKSRRSPTRPHLSRIRTDKAP